MIRFFKEAKANQDKKTNGTMFFNYQMYVKFFFNSY